MGTATSARQWTARHGQQSGKPALSGTMHPDRARSRPRSSDRTPAEQTGASHDSSTACTRWPFSTGRNRAGGDLGRGEPHLHRLVAYNWTTPALKRPNQASYVSLSGQLCCRARSATMPPGGIAPPLFSPTRRPCLAQAGRTSGMNVQAPTSAETLPVAGGLFPSPCAWKRSGRRPIGAPCGRHNEHRALLYALLPGRRRGRRSEPPSFAPQPHGRRVRRLSQHAQRPGGLLPLHAQFGVRRSDHPGRR